MEEEEEGEDEEEGRGADDGCERIDTREIEISIRRARTRGVVFWPRASRRTGGR